MRIGPYELIEEIARGGMGVVYRAFDPALDRQVAIKVITVEHGDGEFHERFRREAQAAARLRHPGIVAVHVSGVADGRSYLVMDLVEGESLAQRLKAGPLPPEEAIRLTCELAEAVEFAHQHGILHRDLKPGNVMLQGGHALLTDFGLAKVAGLSSLTESGTALGTPQYMSPEQARGDSGELGPATDVYGLGATLYAMLAGTPPFAKGPLIQVLTAVVEQPPRSLTSLRPGLDPRLEAVCKRCLAKEPSARYGSPRRLAQVLRELQGAPEQTPARSERGWQVLPWALVALASTWALWATVQWRAAESRLRAQVDDPAPPVSPPSPVESATPEPVESVTPPPADSAALGRLFAELRERDGAGDYRGVKEVASRLIALAPEDPRGYCRRATAHYELSDPAAALADAQRALALAPQLVDAWLAMAQAQVGRGDLQQAMAATERALELEPGDPYALGIRGTLHAAAGEPDAALRDLGLAIQGAPQNGMFRLNRGRLRLRLGDPDGVVDLRKAVELNPQRPAALEELGNALAQFGEPEAGLRYLDQALRLDSMYMPAWLNRGFLRHALGDFEGAAADQTRAIELEPSATAFTRRALAHLELGRRQLGLCDLELALLHDPDYLTARVNRGIVYAELGRLPEGIFDLERALARPDLPAQQRELVRANLEQARRRLPPPGPPRLVVEWVPVLESDPQNPRTYYGLGLALAREQEARSALEAFNQALQLGFRGAEVYAHRGLARAGLGDVEGGLADQEHALELDPRCAAALTGRALIRIRLGRTQEGLADVEAALAIDPAYGPAYHARGMGRSELDDLVGAVEDLQRAYELEGDVSYLFNRGLFLQQLDQPERALQDYLVFLSWYPTFAQAWANYGGILLERGDLVGGEAALSRCLELAPDLPAEIRRQRDRARGRLEGR